MGGLRHASLPFFTSKPFPRAKRSKFQSFLLHSFPKHTHDRPDGGILSKYGRSNRGCNMSFLGSFI